MPMNEFVDKKVKIGLFDSGIGGFSILTQLLNLIPQAEYFYFSDDANAPYGPKSDEFITQRSIEITELLIDKGVALIVVACNTATAASIDILRTKFTSIPFVGVEPYLNAYYKMPEGNKNVAVLTTESTGKSERFKRLKEKLDPAGNIVQYSLPNLARLIEDFYFKRINQQDFLNEVHRELGPLESKRHSHLILGCTHYPLINKIIEKETGAIPVSPDRYVALRVAEVLKLKVQETFNDNHPFYFCSSSNNNQWVIKHHRDCLLPLINC